MFIDYVKIRVKAGQGGSGASSFRREKYVPKGGPSGGDGGRGGSIILEVDPHLHTLIDFKYRKHYLARHGQHGSGKNQHGRDAVNIIVKVPAGTVVKDAESEEILADLIKAGDRFIAARGGRGGRGNARFVTATHQAPREWEVGESGEERSLILELKLLADVGLVGQPNAGKSTLLSKLSAARPKIADYPFTTLQPNLGIVRIAEFKSFVMADIPGLIKGAHQGKGLGTQFLRHVERTRIICYLIDPTTGAVKDTYKILASELKSYSNELIKKPYLIVLTKKDLWEEDYASRVRKSFKFPISEISALDGSGLEDLKWRLWEQLEKITSQGK
jgi:GTP-binding protein